MKTINYTGSSKLISRIVNLLNRRAPLPLDGDGDPDWGTNGQVLVTDGTGSTNWVTPPAAQVQSDWNEADNTKADYIKNKPTIPAAQIQSDWSQSDSTAVDFIKNKPTIPSSSGHTIWNAIKTALTQRTKLWFADAKVTDDSTEQATKVEVVQLIDDESELDDAPDGVYQGDYEDAPEGVLDASMVAYDDGSVEDALDDAKIFYKDITIAGVVVSNYWAYVSSGVSASDYTAIGFAEGGIWDEKIYFSVARGNSLNIKSQTASYTIPSNRTPIRMYFVKNNTVNATPLT